MDDAPSATEDLFGALTAELAARVVAASREAHQIGVRTQAASEQSQRYGYGSTWPSRFERLIEHVADLPGTDVVAVPRTSYRVPRVAGRFLIPFVLAHATADIPVTPRLTSEPLRDLIARGVPRPVAPMTLFELDAPTRGRPEPDPGTPAAVLIGVVCRAEAAELDALYWGPATSIDDVGVVTWEPVALALGTEPTVPAPRSPHERPGPDHPSR